MKRNDYVVFKYNGTTLKYQIVEGSTGWFLAIRPMGLNRQIFILLEIENRFTFCEEAIGYSIKDTTVDFPQVKTLEDLEKIVNALYQCILDISTPKFKKGEIVKILSKDGPSSDYPCGYMPKMEEFANTTTIILKVRKMSSVNELGQYMQSEKYEEPFLYDLNGNVFSWSSAMLELVSNDKDKKEKRNPPKFNIGDKVKVKILDQHHTYGVHLNCGMLRYSGQEFEIKSYNRGIALRTEKCDGYVYSLKGTNDWAWSSDMLEDWAWSSDMLEKCENTTKHELDTAPWTTEEKDSSVDYKLNFTVNSLDFKK